MGEVICTYKVIPDEVEAFDQVKESVEALNPNKMETEPIAFGLNAVVVTFLVPEQDGALEELENNLNSIEHVSAVELINMTRSL